ncbi:MAG: hypothetical protein ACYSU7_08925 [Planctomycetota bacterium]|jgi:hypothetical protein
MRGNLLIVGLVVATAGGRSADANFLDLELRDAPDILSGFIDVTYDADSDQLIAQGFALSLDDGLGPADNITGGTFEIAATIDEIGAAFAGTLDIGGEVTGFGPSLLQADLIDFGFDPVGGVLLELLFTVTGGDLAQAYGGIGGLVGVILDIGGGGYSGDFTDSFDNLIGGTPGTGLGVADTAPLIPGPPALALLLLSGLCRRQARER